MGQYKVTKDHTMTLHGYRRPGYGYVEGQCEGVGHEPFEYEHKLTGQIISRMHDDERNLTEKVELIDQGKIKRVPNPLYRKEGERSRWYDDTTAEYLVPADGKAFSHRVGILRAQLMQDIRHLKSTIEYYEDAVRHWTKGDIVGIDTPATGKTIELRDGYDAKTVEARAEQAKKKAERAAKPGKLYLNIYAEIEPLDRSIEDEHEWRAQIERMRDDEASVKAHVKAWVKARYPEGKVWVGDVDTYFIERHQRELRGKQLAGVNAKIDWSYVDDIRREYGEKVVVDNPKEVRVILSAEELGISFS